MVAVDSSHNIWLCHHLLRGVVSVHLQILLVGTCQLCGSWSVAGHSHRKVIGQDPICVDLHNMGLGLSGNGWADHVWWGRSKPACQIVGLVTTDWLTTEACLQLISPSDRQRRTSACAKEHQPTVSQTVHKRVLLSFEMQPPYPSQVLRNPCVALFALLNNVPYKTTTHRQLWWPIQWPHYHSIVGLLNTGYS